MTVVTTVQPIPVFDTQPRSSSQKCRIFFQFYQSVPCFPGTVVSFFIRYDVENGFFWHFGDALCPQTAQAKSFCEDFAVENSAGPRQFAF